MVEVIGCFKSPKSVILKLNTQINLSNMASHDLKMVLLKPEANVDPYSLDTFTGDIATYEQDYAGYSRQSLTNILRIDTIQDGYIWLADDVTFEDLNATIRYAMIIDNANNNILSVLDLEDDYTFLGDVTFDLNVHGFFGSKV